MRLNGPTSRLNLLISLLPWTPIVLTLTSPVFPCISNLAALALTMTQLANCLDNGLKCWELLSSRVVTYSILVSLPVTHSPTTLIRSLQLGKYNKKKDFVVRCRRTNELPPRSHCKVCLVGWSDCDWVMSEVSETDTVGGRYGMMECVNATGGVACTAVGVEYDTP